MIAHADVTKPPAMIQPATNWNGRPRFVFVIKGNSWNGFYRVRVLCSKTSCGPVTLGAATTGTGVVSG
jgi:hypothetical protein